MPVKGIMPGLLEIGKIKIGVKGEWVESTTGVKFRPPKKLDHFLITTNEKNEAGDYLVDTDLIEKLKAGGKAKVNADGHLIGIPIRLLYNDIDLCFPTRYVCYKGAKVAWYSNDGVTMHTRDGREMPFNPALVDPTYTGEDKGKINGVLSVIIEGAETFGGCWKFRTTSTNTVKSILGSLSVIKHATGGRLAFLPLMLTVQPKSTVIPGSGAPTTVHIVSVVFQGSVEQLQQKAISMARENAEYLIEMKAVEAEARRFADEAEIMAGDGDDEAEIAKEFYPETVAAAGVGDTAAEPAKQPEPETGSEPEVATNQEAAAVEPPAAAATEMPDHVEEVPPTAPKWDLKNPDDPTDPVNWFRRGSNFADYVNEFLAEFQAAPNDVKQKLVDKWGRLAATARKPCPVQLDDQGEKAGPEAGTETETQKPKAPSSADFDMTVDRLEKHCRDKNIGYNRDRIVELLRAYLADADEERIAKIYGLAESKPDMIVVAMTRVANQQATANEKAAVNDTVEVEAEVKAEPEAATNAEPVTRENLTKIVQLKKAMAINDMAVWQRLIEPYQVETAKNMTNEQAVDFINRLKAMQDDPSLIPS